MSALRATATFFIGGALLATPALASGASTEPVRFGSFTSEIAGLAEPSAVAIGPNGRVYVAEELAHRVSVWDVAGTRIASFGTPGSGPGELLEPQGIAVAADGTVYVSDTANHRVCVFDGEGRFQRAIGRRGTEAGEFNQPLGLAVVADRVYVADARNHRVQVFDGAGTFVRQIGRGGRGPGELSQPVDVAVDSSGAVYVADLDAARIDKFDGAGAFVASFGDFGPFSGLFASPSGIRCFEDLLYVADRDNHRIQVFDLRGAVVYEWGLHALRPREGAGKLHYPNQIAIAPSGKFAIVAEAFEDRLQIFGPQVKDALGPLVQDKSAGAHYGAGIDRRGKLCALVEPPAPDALVLDVATGTPIEITRFGFHGTKPGSLVRPVDIAIAPDAESVWISDPGTARVSLFRVARRVDEPLRFDPVLAHFVKSIDFEALPRDAAHAARSWTLDPGALECDGAGQLYLVDQANACVVVFGPDLALRRTFGRFGRGEGELLRPTSIAFSRAGDVVYVVDAAAAHVVAFDLEGRTLFSFGQRGSGEGDFVRPFGCAAGQDGFVYVTDEGAHAIDKFDERGHFVAKFGRQGLGRAEFYRPQGIVHDVDGRLWVVDGGNHRGQILATDGSFIDAFGSRLFVLPTLGGKR